MYRFRRMGLQRRIMLLVTAGLATMFTVGGLIGLRAIDDAGNLVFRERLATAYATVAIVERHFDHLAADVYLLEQMKRPDADAQAFAEALLTGVGGEAHYTFFTVTGLDLVDARGLPIASTGRPAIDERSTSHLTAPLPEAGRISVQPATWTVDGEVPMADVIVPFDVSAAGDIGGVRLHATSVNSSTAFDPAEYTGRRAGPTAALSQGTPFERYNLEIVDPDGVTLLSLGTSGRPGTATAHREHIADVVAARSATALVDPGDAAHGIEPHVVAAVPMAVTPYYLLLEQPTDVALELPNQARQRLLVLISIGFMAALVVAWVTTRRVVKPTEELTRAASRMAEGNLGEPIDVTAQDEIASLAETLELMRQRLLDALEALERSNRELERRVAERTARLGFVLRKTISAQEDERHALARELHDETAQTLAALTIALDRAREEAGRGSGSGRERIAEAKSIAERLLAETRRLIMGLRPTVLDDMGLGPAIAWYAETIMPELRRSTRVSVDAFEERMPRHLEVALYRVAQEALNNVAKHAEASTATVQLAHHGHDVQLTVEDDGVGFDVSEAMERAAVSGGVGLAGMQERVALLGGSMAISAIEGHGTRIVVRVPVASSEA